MISIDFNIQKERVKTPVSIKNFKNFKKGIASPIRPPERKKSPERIEYLMPTSI